MSLQQQIDHCITFADRRILQLQYAYPRLGEEGRRELERTERQVRHLRRYAAALTELS